MSAVRHRWHLALLATACMTLAASAFAMKSGNTAQGRRFVTGGVSSEELVALHAKRDAYSLWVVTAALRSGAHLADVHVVIRDAKGQPVYDGRLDGPWLFVDLPLGRYEVAASYKSEAHQRVTTIHPGDHHQVFFYFDTGDTLSPENQPPFERSPYDGPKK